VRPQHLGRLLLGGRHLPRQRHHLPGQLPATAHRGLLPPQPDLHRDLAGRLHRPGRYVPGR
jgi:hypothetical protein